MAIGQRIKRLRHDRGWSQAQLALKINAHTKQISKYEREVSIPSTEVLIRIARVFDVSLDYLVFDDRGNTASTDIADRELVQKLAEIDKFSKHDKTLIKGILDTFILKNRFQQVAEEGGQLESGTQKDGKR